MDPPAWRNKLKGRPRAALFYPALLSQAHTEEPAESARLSIGPGSHENAHMPHEHRPAPVASLIDAARLWPSRGALIGLDLGTKTIGVATSDPDRRLATGVETIARRTFAADAKRLLVLAAERDATGFVLGLPVNMDGTEGPRAQSARAFARNLAKITALPIALWDERMSTAAVERDLIAADASRRKRAAVIDQHAAAFILQGALDRLGRRAAVPD